MPYKLVTEMIPEDYLAAFRGKVLNQIELVHQGVSRIAERGSFTLITGMPAREPIPSGSAASMANGAVEAFVRAAAIEIAPQRIKRRLAYGLHRKPRRLRPFFPGMPPVDLADVAQAYIRSVEGAQTGQDYAL